MQSYLNGFREIDLSFGRILHSLLRADETPLTLAFTSRPGRRGRGGEVLPFTSYIASVALKDGVFFYPFGATKGIDFIRLGLEIGNKRYRFYTFRFGNGERFVLSRVD